MPRYRLTRWLLAAGFPLSAVACFVIADTPPPPTKREVESPTKAVVANSAPTAPTPPPKGKYVIELPTKAVVANSTPTTPAAPTAVDNPTVESGLVKWHKTLDEAQAAAKKSHKPVLLFQMMGYLDKQFC